MGAGTGVRKGPYSREVWAWAFYDFANSAYSTALSGVIFSVFFVQVIVGPEGIRLFGFHLRGSSLWGLAVSTSMVLVALTAPTLGAISDYRACKKRLLFYFCYLGVAATALLVLVGPGDVLPAIFLYVLSNFCLESSLTFYNGFLPEIASRGEMGRISGFGWALGYVGGVLCLLLCLGLISRPGWFGMSPEDHMPVRMTLLIVGLWWGVFSIPTFMGLRERSAPAVGSPEGVLRAGLLRLYHTLLNLKRYKELVKFLVSFLIYNDGVQTVIIMAAVFGAEILGMQQDELILCFIVTHLVAFIGSLAFGFLADRMTTKWSIHLSLMVWTAAVLYVLVIDEVWEFWVLAVLVGFVLGGTQAASRALLAQFTPVANSAEFFGFFSMGGKFAAILGPTLFALVSERTGTARWGVFSVLLFFVVGWGLLFLVDEEEGMRQAATPVE